MSSRVLTCVVAGVVLAAGFVSTAQADVVIAQYNFEDGANFLADSSGNGHDLTTATGTVTWAAGPGGVGGAANFNGSSFLKTISDLDLSAERHIRVSWAMNYTTSGIAWGSTALDYGWYSANNGEGFTAGLSILQAGVGFAGMSERNNGANTGYTIQQYPHSYGVGNTTWDNMVMELDLDGATFSDQVKVWRNGTLATLDDYGMDTPAAAFVSSPLVLGALSNGTSAFFGNIAGVTIESLPQTIPEPSTLVLFSTGLIGLTAYAWRKRKVVSA